jgi:GT2 family glycosyltransferase
VKVLENPVNRGFAQPNNLAAKHAKGSVLALINNDMRVHPNWIREGLKGLDQAACTACRILDWNGERIDFNGSSLQYLGYANQKDIGQLAAEVTSENQLLFPCGGAMFIEKSVFLDAGGFDEDFFAIYEDVDLGWRLWVLGHEVSYSPESVVYHRGHATFETQHSAKMRFLMHRNALLTVLKNYDDELVRKVIPLAVILSVRRSIRCSGVMKESFYLWDGMKSRLENGDKNAYLEVLDALNHLVSVDDMLRLLPRMMVKRRRIQSRRKRTDPEIFALFQDPLRPIVEEANYLSNELEYLKLLELDNYFSTDHFEKFLSDLPNPLTFHMENLRKEIVAIQTAQVQTLRNEPVEIPPVRSPASRWEKFLQIWKHSGFKIALKTAIGALKRGH